MQKASVFLSVLCAIHCLALPLLAAAMTTGAFTFLENPILEFVFLLPIICLSGVAIYRHFKQNGNIRLIGLPMAALIVLLLAVFAHLHILLAASALYLAYWQWTHKSCAHNSEILV